jgi:hypothetical protein
VATLDLSDVGPMFWVWGFAVWVLMLYGLRAGLDRVEASLETRARESRVEEPGPLPLRYDQPESVGEIIGRYMGAPIYGEVTLHGRKYRYDRVQSPEMGARPAVDECCLRPGVVYVSRAQSG